MFISETIIDAIVEQLEVADFEKEVALFGKRQPALISYVFSEDFELLTQREREWMLYLMIVILYAIEREKKVTLKSVSKKALEIAEERNLELLDGVSENRFRERMTVFFDDSEQEDLLAFVEDSLVDDEDSFITKEGREPMFVALKSVIDVCCEAQ